MEYLIVVFLKFSVHGGGMADSLRIADQPAGQGQADQVVLAVHSEREDQGKPIKLAHEKCQIPRYWTCETLYLRRGSIASKQSGF